MRRCNSIGICHIGTLRYIFLSHDEKPRWIAPKRFIPTWLRRCMAPIHSSGSGLTGFFTNTGPSKPRKLSASSCMAKGLVAVRAPTQSISTSYFNASSTCSGIATSVAVSIPVSFLTACSQGKAFSPFPSKPPGFVRGFHTPARNIRQPLAANWRAVVITCSSVSAEQGPAITIGRSPLSDGRFRG